MPVTISRETKGNGHWYTVTGGPVVEGVKLPGVTSALGVIAKHALIPWARNVALEKVRDQLSEEKFVKGDYNKWIDSIITRAKKRPDEVRDAAADYGTRAHQVVEQWIGGRLAYPADAPDDLLPALDGYLAWQRDSGLTIEKSEVMVYCACHRIAGTLDLLAWWETFVSDDCNTDYCIVDLKTSAGIYPEMDLQVAAYAHMYNQMHDTRIKDGWILRLPKKAPTGNQPAFEARRVEDMAAAFKAFEGALVAWRYLKAK